MNQGRMTYHRSLWSGGTPIDLLEVLASLRGSKASDLKGMIFGYAAVTDNSRPKKPQLMHHKWPRFRYWNPDALTRRINYRQSVAQVYTDAAIHSASIDTPNGIRRLLYHAATKASHAKRDDLPSWVPDWALEINDLQGRCWPFSKDPMKLVDISLPDELNFCYIPVKATTSEVQPREVLTFFLRTTAYDVEIVEHANQLAIDDRQLVIDSCAPIFIFQMLRSMWKSLVAAELWPRPQHNFSILFRIYEELVRIAVAGNRLKNH
ncbi:hypothetical protein sscle_07g056520 [Sclerotinia sclerotiorum 1980 UF-70]|uniref:Uncharacterized protein n=1 Tax=Sclerotinia sclerotiorum (strain ATCC 18683 / 1980 / Ss-1) TaxID=665079 RepID=A0A1D9Q7U9_SCLS1|nr:hypothetical protein sscle_07g056520 [Sclerotinia sclerotiorum 1980 UF-70]